MAQPSDISPLVTGPVAENYARALFELAEPAGKAQPVLEELRELLDILDAHPALRAVLLNRTIDRGRRAESIRNIFAGRLDDVVFRFLLVLNHRNRIDALPAVASVYDRLLKEHRNQIDVHVLTARPLPDDQKAQLRQRLEAVLKREPILHEKLDASLIGGLRLRVGDQLIDASVSTRLRRLARELVSSAHENLRQRTESILG